VESTDNFGVVTDWRNGFSGFFNFFLVTADENDDALVGGGDIEPEAEVWEIGNCCGFAFSFGSVVISDFSKG
jgi:hypothetical protein